MTSISATTPCQRSFVGRKNKMTAADVRRHVMTGSLLMHPTTVNSTDGPQGPLVLPDVVEPCDIEEALAIRKTSYFYDISSSTTSPRKVSEFPTDDIEVRVVERELHTIDTLIPSNLQELSIEHHVRDIMGSFTDDFSLVQRRYQQYSSAEAYMKMLIERPVILRDLSRPIYEQDGYRFTRGARSASVVIELSNQESNKRHSYGSTASSGTMGSGEGEGRESRLNQSQPDPTIPGVTQRVSFAQLDQMNDAKRQMKRHQNLVNLLPVQKESDVVERRSPPPYPDDSFGQKLILRINQLNVEPYFEPIFGLMAIYDAKSRRKVTENFHFDVNSQEILALLDGNTQTVPDRLETRCNQAVFSLSGSLAELFLVIKLEKTLQACEVSDAAEPYCVVRDDRGREKLSQQAREYCARLGGYRMPLGFMVVDLQKVLTGARSLNRTDVMTASTFTAGGGSVAGEAPLACTEVDSESIMSADRVSLASSSTFRRMGSGTSAATVLQRVRTPIQKRKHLGQAQNGSEDGNAGSLASNQDVSSKTSEPVLANFQPLTLTLNSFFKQEGDRLSDEDLYRLLADARKPGGKLSKLKTFPVDMSLQLSGGNAEELQMRMSPELLRIAPFSGGPNSVLTKDVQEFPGKGQYAVNASYRNLMYVYPKSVNLSSRPGTARNISIRVEMMNGKEIPQKVVFNSNAGLNLNDHARTAVVYHCKTPKMADEVKLRIPIDIDDGYHLLFTFYHISCKTGNKEEEFEYPIGYTWLPLYKDGKLTSGDFYLPVCLERPPTSYGYLSPIGALPNIKWLDGHKPLFNVVINAVSSVHPQDAHLEKFFLSVNSLASVDHRKPPATEQEVVAAVQGILKSRPEPMVAFLYNVLDKLLNLISHPPYTMALSAACFETLGHLVKICTVLLDSCLDSHGRSSLLVSYVHYFKIALKESKAKSPLCKASGDANSPGSPETQKLFNIIEDVERSSTGRIPAQAVPTTSNKCVHEELVDLWVRSGTHAREMAFINSWFFFELMMKSMTEYLSMTGRLYLVRRSRFSDRFLRALDSLSAAVAAEVLSRLSKDARQSTALAHSYAFFLRDAFSIMDRTYIMGLVRNFNQAISVKISCGMESASTTLMLLKLDFIRIISSHEHFIILNLPFSSTVMSSSSSAASGLTANSQQQQPPVSPGSASTGSRSSGCFEPFGELNADFRRRHYLIGLALADLSAVLDGSSSGILQSRSIGVIRNLLAAHEADSRLSDASVRARLASLYLPLVSIVLDVSPQLYDTQQRRGTSPYPEKFGDDYPDSSVDPKVGLAIAGMGKAPSPPPRSISTEFTFQKPRLNLELTRQLLSCFCWVLKNVDSGSLSGWIRDMAPARLSQLFDVLQLCVACFEYKPVELDDTSLNRISGETDHGRKGGCEPAEGIKWRKESSSQNASSHRSSVLVEGEMGELILEATLSTEVTLCVLDVIEIIMRVIGMPGNDHLLFAIPLVLKELLHILSGNQSVQTLDNVFASQRALTVKYPELIFEQEIDQCSELCLQLLRHSASLLPAIRSQAAASLYLLLRECYESGSSLARLKMQITMSLSTLVSNRTRTGMWLNEDCLRRSLRTVLIYAQSDAESDQHTRANAGFSEQVKDLVFNLHMILSDTVKMKDYVNDFEMTLDLMYRVAKGYQNNPDLRLTWLLNMSSRHVERGLYCEAAECMLHAAALAAEYIAMTTTDGFMPRGAVDFHCISNNVLEESAVSDDVVSPKSDGVCESRHFTASGLVHLVEKCALFLEKAQMFELLPDLFKVVEPIVREWRDFRRLSSIHAQLSSALARIEPTVAVVEDTADAWLSPLRSSDKRCFGTYFRVGFYGAQFDDLDGEEFIYKEPPFTKLSEISHRLELFYVNKFGKDMVEIIKDSSNVSRSSFCSNKAYLQITYVEPYFDKWELRRRPTHFERGHSIKRFMYATPFTRDGRSHGDLKDQFKRRTILTTQHSFPYVKTRIRVTEREQKVLQPIQVAIEDIEKKTRELSAAIHQSPPDAKMLQMVLQGCIGTTVNQGPVQVANVFLADVPLDNRGKPVDKLQNKLRLAFRDFSKRCADALSLNKNLIQPDQLAYQNELQKNFVDFTRRMSPIMGGGGGMNSKKEKEASVAPDEKALAAALETGQVSAV